MSLPSNLSSIVIVGGGPAGLATARSYREAGGEAEVTLVCEEPRPPYERPPLSKELLRGESDAAAILIEKQAWFEEHKIRLRLGVVARSIDLEAGTVTTSDGARLRAEAIVMATGSEPLRPPVPGADDASVLTFRRLSDSRRLALRTRPGRPVLVIGSGFIGCEIAVSLRLRGHPVSLVSDEPAPNQRRLGQHAAWVIETWLRDSGVAVTLDATVSAIERRDGELQVVSDRGRLGAPVVVFATGVAPRSQLLTGRELLSDGGRIAVDSSMRTQVPGLFAAGDVALAHNDACGRPLPVEHWGDALGQGQVAGTVAAGRSATWDDVPGFWSTIGDHTLKYAAWGDGYDDSRVERPDQDDAFTVWYGRENAIVGVLTHNADEHYERGRELIKEGAPWQTR
jgi:NADPH-dependent 2,4-dienoyl-CoA reductase/sulfur reductase-like enzyme